MRLISDFRRLPFLLVFSSVSAGSEEHNSDDGDDVKLLSGTEGSTSSSLPFLLVFSSVSAGPEEHNSDDGDDVKLSSGTEGSTSSSLAFVTENYGKKCIIHAAL
jgi:hypothetical protein